MARARRERLGFSGVCALQGITTILFLLIGLSACRTQTSKLSAGPDFAAYRMEYQVINPEGPEFHAQITLYPRADANLRVEFDFPYAISEFLGVQIQRRNSRYVISKIEPSAASNAEATVLKFKATGNDGGARPPSNATFTIGVPVNVVGNTQNQHKDQESGKGNEARQSRGGSSLCITEDYGLGTQAVGSVRSSYPAQGDLKNLPALSVQANNRDLKVFVAQVYDQFPTFQEIYEKGLSLTREEALSFMYGDMSRESATNHPVTGKLVWYIELETATSPPGNPAHAWGPFQAAVTNFLGGGYDSEILSKTGLPTPTINDFRDPAISTFAGMKRLVEGIVAAAEYFGPNKPSSLYLLGTLAHHNTGWVNSAEQQTWRDGYGKEVLRLAQAYRFGSNMKNDIIFYTGQAESEICR